MAIVLSDHADGIVVADAVPPRHPFVQTRNPPVFSGGF